MGITQEHSKKISIQIAHERSEKKKLLEPKHEQQKNWIQKEKTYKTVTDAMELRLHETEKKLQEANVSKFQIEKKLKKRHSKAYTNLEMAFQKAKNELKKKKKTLIKQEESIKKEKK